MRKEKHILIIDPDDKERNALVKYLKEQKYQVECGKGLTDALKKIAGENFKCLIMDVDLPELRGYEAVSIIKNIDPKIKIIMTTKKNSRNLESKVREQDIYYYFIKSFGNDELKLAINNAFKL